MGLIKAGAGALGTSLADEWKEFIYCDSLDQDILMRKGQARAGKRSSNTKRDENIISDGSKIAVNEGQAMLVVENGKVVDFCAEPGAYIYQTGAEPSVFDTGFSGIRETLAKIGGRFTYGGQPYNDQRVYFINVKEIFNNKIGFGDVPFRDSEFNFTIRLKGFGSYTFKITNPVLFYTNVCANAPGIYPKSQLLPQMRTEIQQAIQPALGNVALKGIAYDQITLHTKEVAELLNEEMGREWRDLRGIEIISFAMASIKPDEESADKINQFQEARFYTNPSLMGARIGTAQANAMEGAANNQAGAMAGFMGMGMASQAGANAATLMAMGQQSQETPAQPQAPVAPAAASEGWKCPSCGSVNQGKFCAECGAKKPAGASLFRCDKCGWQPPDPSRPPKFCPECGDRFTEDDQV